MFVAQPPALRAALLIAGKPKGLRLRPREDDAAIVANNGVLAGNLNRNCVCGKMDVDAGDGSIKKLRNQ